MNRYRVFALVAALMLILLAGINLTAAQDDCGDGLPCGKLPWDLPQLPALPSPTPMPTIGVTINPPTQTPGGPTATPIPPTANGFGLDIDGISNQFATLQGLAEATDPVIEVSGTPVSNTGQLATLAANSGTFFGYVRAVSEIDLGGLTPLIGFVTLSFLTVFSVKVITLLVPTLVALFGFIKKVVEIVLNFLP